MENNDKLKIVFDFISEYLGDNVKITAEPKEKKKKKKKKSKKVKNKKKKKSKKSEVVRDVSKFANKFIKIPNESNTGVKRNKEFRGLAIKRGKHHDFIIDYDKVYKVLKRVDEKNGDKSSWVTYDKMLSMDVNEVQKNLDSFEEKMEEAAEIDRKTPPNFPKPPKMSNGEEFPPVPMNATDDEIASFNREYNSNVDTLEMIKREVFPKPISRNAKNINEDKKLTENKEND